jgi:hypothetical protein
MRMPNRKSAVFQYVPGKSFQVDDIETNDDEQYLRTSDERLPFLEISTIIDAQREKSTLDTVDISSLYATYRASI